MEIDLASAGAQLLPNPGVLQAQVCIVGGGIAGLVLADALVTQGIEVVLLEAGGHSAPSTEERERQQVELTGEIHTGTLSGRPQALGGSSLVWGGQLLPILPEENDWPVRAADFVKYTAAVEHLVGVDATPFDAGEFLVARGSPPLDIFKAMPQLAARMSKFAPFGSRNLGRLLGARLRGHTKARVVLHAQVTELRVAEGERVEAVELRTPGGGELAVRAEYIVLAAGTVETCRLLLSSRASQDGAALGVGNHYGQVGRGFHDHLTLEVARFTGASRALAAAQLRPWITGGLRGTLHGLKLEPNRRTRERLGLNFALAHVTFEEPEQSGAATVRSILQVRQKGRTGEPIPWRGLPRVLRESWRLRQEAVHQGRRYVSPAVRVGLRINVAQAVPGRSFVGLSERRDSHGTLVPRVHWETPPEDLRTLRVFTEHLRHRLRRLAWKDLQWNSQALSESPRGVQSWPSEVDRALERPMPGLEDARHAMGGARMGTDPRSSVVDPDLKVHGLQNLFLASAAVFPDGRPQLPTLTLMALTLRLAAHLKGLFTRA